MSYLQKAVPVFLLLIVLLLAALLLFPSGILRPAAAQTPAVPRGQMIEDKGNLYILDDGTLSWYLAVPNAGNQGGQLRLMSRVTAH